MTRADRVRPDRRAWLRRLAATATVTPLLRWAVLVHSVPPEEPWRSACPHCAAPFAPGAAPTNEGLGALTPRGRCAGCGRRLGPPAGVVEFAAVAAAAAALAGVAGGWWSPWAAAALVGWLPPAVALTFVDLAVHRLPDRFTVPAAGWVLAWLGVAALAGEAGDAWLRAAAAGAACAAGFALVTLLSGSKGFGLGDAKLVLSAAALLAWQGWTALVAGLLLAFLASGATAAVLLATRRVDRRDALPFGPFLVLGVCATVVWVAASS